MAEPEPDRYWCDDEHHSGCWHVPLGAVEMDNQTQTLRVGRDVSEVPLCQCSCHLDCPLSAQDNGAGWPEVCQCPGTRRYLRLGEHRADFWRVVRRSLDRSRRQSSAQNDLHRRARGLDREEVDRLVDEVWAVHGLEQPPAHVKPMIVDRAMRPRDPLQDMATTADVVHGTAKWISGIVGAIRNASHEADTQRLDPFKVFRIEPGEDSVEVELDEEVQGHLAAMGGGPGFSSRTLTTADVELRPGSGEDEIEVWELTVTTASEPTRLGSLRSEKTAPYRASVAAAQRVGQVAIGVALRTSAPNGSWRLYLMLPRP